MWYLKSENDKRVIYVLSSNNITIGRSVDTQLCNFALPDDPSISRKHATLSISSGNLFLEDFGSKYGTFVNDSGDKIEHNHKLQLNSGDKIKFGKMGSVWNVKNINITTCTSTLDGDDLQILKNNLSKLDGVFKSTWDDSCSYLTMPVITLTIKVVLALGQGSYIVSTEFWNKCVEAVKSNKALPDPSNYLPHTSEPFLQQTDASFLPSQHRQALFVGRKVLFFSRKQLEMYREVLIRNGASPQLLQQAGKTKSQLCDSDIIVIQHTSSAETQAQKSQINDIAEHLKRNGRRLVADAEIGLAILFCSTSIYCNPDLSFSSEFVRQMAYKTKGNKVLAEETQEQPQVENKNNIKIDESLSPQNMTINNFVERNDSSKRKYSEDESDLRCVYKKIATDNTKPNDVNCKKRAAEDSDLINPFKKRNMLNDIAEDEMFNFIDDATENKEDPNKKLNLFKTQKRKFDCREDDEGLFNFIEDSTAVESQNDHGSVLKKIKIQNEINKDYINVTGESKVDTIALRGIKLQELMENNSNMISCKQIKKEDTSEISEMLSNIDLGSTVLVVNKDLIVKKETIESPAVGNGVINFKKFRKVWPVKYQISV